MPFSLSWLASYVLAGGMFALESFIVYCLITGSAFAPSEVFVVEGVARMLLVSGGMLGISLPLLHLDTEKFNNTVWFVSVFFLLVSVVSSETYIDIFLLKKSYFFFSTAIFYFFLAASMALVLQQKLWREIYANAPVRSCVTPSLAAALMSLLIGIIFYFLSRNFPELLSRQTTQIASGILLFVTPLAFLSRVVVDFGISIFTGIGSRLSLPLLLAFSLVAFLSIGILLM